MRKESIREYSDINFVCVQGISSLRTRFNIGVSRWTVVALGVRGVVQEVQNWFKEIRIIPCMRVLKSLLCVYQISEKGSIHEYSVINFVCVQGISSLRTRFNIGVSR